MTDNLYLKGTVKNKNEFLYDLGTGYYSKLSADQIKNQFQYTKNFCNQNEGSLIEDITQKQEALKKVASLLQLRQQVKS